MIELISSKYILESKVYLNQKEIIPYSIKMFDHGDFALSNQPGRFSIPYNGLYKIKCSFEIESRVGIFFLYQNGIKGIKIVESNETNKKVSRSLAVSFSSREIIDIRAETPVILNESNDGNYFEIMLLEKR